MGILEVRTPLKTLLDQHIKATYFALYETPFSCQTNYKIPTHFFTRFEGVAYG